MAETLQKGRGQGASPTPDPHSSSPFLEISELSKSYPNSTAPAVAGVTLGVERGEFLALLGPSGCGKTTTLRMLAGLVEPTSGTVRLDGEEITRKPVHMRSMGMVFQSYALFPHLDVKSNVAYGLKMRRTPKAQVAERVAMALAAVRLEHLADRRVQALSGGQQQRVALARAIVIEPALFLMDEPLSNLDAKLRDAMRREIREIQQRMGITAVFVTHDQDEALTMADRIAVMSEGRLEQFGTPTEIYERPASRFVAEFVGTANLFERVSVTHHGDSSLLDLPGIGRLALPRIASAPATAIAMLRPHQLRLRPGADGAAGELAGVVRSATYFGDTLQYQVEIGSMLVTVHAVAGASETLPVGAAVSVSLAAGSVHLIAPA